MAISITPRFKSQYTSALLAAVAHEIGMCERSVINEYACGGTDSVRAERMNETSSKEIACKGHDSSPAWVYTFNSHRFGHIQARSCGLAKHRVVLPIALTGHPNYKAYKA